MASDLTGLGRRPERQQLPDEVATYVRELILSGQVRAGEFLRMDRIAEAVGVSNTPVREGLQALTAEGIVELLPRRGFVVAPLSRESVLDLFWAQARFASELAARAAKKITVEQLDRLDAINAQLEQAVAGNDMEAIAALAHNFHREINLAADSRRLAFMLGSVVKRVPARYYATIEEQIAAERNDHPLLVDALRARDVRRARTLAEKHILQGADAVVHMLEERGLWDD